MNKKYAFLTSVRFWQLFLAAVAAGLTVYDQTGNIITSITTAIGSWLSASVVVGTVDRNADKKVEAAKATK